MLLPKLSASQNSQMHYKLPGQTGTKM